MTPFGPLCPLSINCKVRTLMILVLHVKRQTFQNHATEKETQNLSPIKHPQGGNTEKVNVLHLTCRHSGKNCSTFLTVQIIAELKFIQLSYLKVMTRKIVVKLYTCEARSFAWTWSYSQLSGTYNNTGLPGLSCANHYQNLSFVCMLLNCCANASGMLTHTKN